MHSDKPVSKHSSAIGITEYTDDMAKMGQLEFMYYTHGLVDDIHHRLGCPGCDPKAPANPALAEWFRIEAKWRARGEAPACPIERQRWYSENNRGKRWWREEIHGIAHYVPLPGDKRHEV